jgi:hypothetical protein
MALHVLAYNMKRVIAILGVPRLIEAMAAFLLWLAAMGRPWPGSRRRRDRFT